MKHSKLILSLIALICFSFANAQREVADSTELMFDANGGLTRVASSEDEAKAKLITVNPRLEDVVWRKMVMRIVDLRELTNRSLYYPVDNISETSQKNLFAIIFKNWAEGKLPSYQKGGDTDLDIPDFTAENIVNPDSTIVKWQRNEHMSANPAIESGDIYGIINALSKGVIKYAIQEIWYFDKSTSTVQNKIIAISPLFDINYGPWNNLGPTEAMLGGNGYWGWFSYEQLRPFLQQEYVRMNGKNIAPLVNFEDFFTKRMFNGYIIRDYDLKSTRLDENSSEDGSYTQEDVLKIKQEQDRIENEILNFEQDLWSY